MRMSVSGNFGTVLTVLRAGHQISPRTCRANPDMGAASAATHSRYNSNRKWIERMIEHPVRSSFLEGV
jgi:hypothetical protein